MDDPLIGQLLNTPCNGEQARVFAAAKSEIEKLRASLGAIHHRVCHGGSTHGLGEAIAAECESAVPALKSLRR
jgi:hypothetical protein